MPRGHFRPNKAKNLKKTMRTKRATRNIRQKSFQIPNHLTHANSDGAGTHAQPAAYGGGIAKGRRENLCANGRAWGGQLRKRGGRRQTFFSATKRAADSAFGLFLAPQTLRFCNRKLSDYRTFFTKRASDSLNHYRSQCGIHLKSKSPREKFCKRTLARRISPKNELPVSAVWN